MYSIMGLSILVDILWFINWESIYKIAASVVESESKVEILSEKIFHNLVLVNSLIVIVLKVEFDLTQAAFMLIVYFSDSDLEKLRSFRGTLDTFTNFITLS